MTTPPTNCVTCEDALFLDQYLHPADIARRLEIGPYALGQHLRKHGHVELGNRVDRGARKEQAS